MTLDPKALEAALNTPIIVDAMIGTIRTAGEMFGSDEIRKVLERAFVAADLISRRDYNWSQEHAARLGRERDEARREAEKQGKQLAALREALGKIAQLQRDKCENVSAGMLLMFLDDKVGIACAALIDTAEAKPEDTE